MTKNIVLITGVTGFLGSRLAQALVTNGHEVIALKRESSKLFRIDSILSSVTLYDIDNLDLATLFKTHSGISTVIHTATCYGKNGESVSEIFEANTVFPLRLLDAACEAGVKTFINTDTILDKYLNLYSLSKNQLLEWGRFFSMHKKIHFSNIRLEHIYGPGDDNHKFTSHVINSCLNNVPELHLTLGEQWRDFIYIDDVVSAYLILIEKMHLFQNMFMEFDIGSGHPISISDFVKNVHNLTTSKTRLVFGAIPYREGEVMFSQADIAPLIQLGWTCKMSLENGLILTIESHK